MFFPPRLPFRRACFMIFFSSRGSSELPRILALISAAASLSDDEDDAERRRRAGWEREGFDVVSAGTCEYMRFGGETWPYAENGVGATRDCG